MVEMRQLQRHVAGMEKGREDAMGTQVRTALLVRSFTHAHAHAYLHSLALHSHSLALTRPCPHAHMHLHSRAHSHSRAKAAALAEATGRLHKRELELMAGACVPHSRNHLSR